ncbi:Homocysteine S-methyltransferase [Aeromicrobium sp. 9AM]|nr:Homocysteine S-methyltransferase [Aeromicrobium sp. 9AM]
MIIDGGLSNALEARGHDLSSELWTAELLRDQPQEIAAVHRAYFEAGAEVATTASYQASVSGFEQAGMTTAEAEALIRLSVAIARDVRDEGPGRLVAASVGPYGAVLADGSEYTGRYGLTATQLYDFHRPRLELLASEEPDLFAVETIPDIDEATVLAGLLDEIGIPAWLSYTIDGEQTRAGQPLSDAFAVVAGTDAVIATGVNCCAPADVLAAVRTAHDVTGKPGVAYPNSGQVWDSATHTWHGDSSYDLSLVPGWLDAGVTYVGGCCRIGPDDIAALAASVA